MRVHESLRPNESDGGRELKPVFESVRELRKARESWRAKESESGQEFTLFVTARELMKARGNWRPSEGESSYSLRAHQS